MSLDVCVWLDSLNKTKMNAALKECALAFSPPPKSSLKDVAQNFEISESRIYQLYNNLNVQCEVVNKKYWSKLSDNEKDVVAHLLKLKESNAYKKRNTLEKQASVFIRTKTMGHVMKKSSSKAKPKAKPVTPEEKKKGIKEVMDLIVIGESVTKVLARHPDIMKYYHKDIQWSIEMPKSLRKVLGMQDHHSNPWLCTYGYKQIEALIKDTKMTMEQGLDDLNIFSDQYAISVDFWGTRGCIFTSNITMDGITGQKIDLCTFTDDGKQILSGRSFWSHSALAQKSFDMLHKLAAEAARQAAMEAAAPKVAGADNMTLMGLSDMNAVTGVEAADDESDDEDAAPPLFFRAASL